MTEKMLKFVNINQENPTKRDKTDRKADFNEIDDTIEELKKEARKQGTSGYACNNIYLILQDALKKVALAGN